MPTCSRDTFHTARSGLQYIKLLVRKVATIYHALNSIVTMRSEHHKGAGNDCEIAGTGRGEQQRSTLQLASHRDSVVIWADEDVEFVHAPDARLLGFARRFDVAYVPFQAPAHTKRFNPEYNFTVVTGS
jgi:hypothetical protein